MKAFIFLLSVLSLRAFSLSPFMIEGPSMDPILQSGEVIMINEFVNTDELKRGDIVVFAMDDEPDYFYIKRVIGLPGEKVRIREDGIYIDDAGGNPKKLLEHYLDEEVKSAPVNESYRENYEHTYAVPVDKFFVLGDNREHSLDSRYFKSPFIKDSEIKGKYLFNIIDL